MNAAQSQPVVGFRPVPVPDQQMLRKGALDPDVLMKSLSERSKDVVNDLASRLSTALEGAIEDVFGNEQGGDVSQTAGRFVAAVLSRVAESLEDRDVPGGPLLAPDVVEKAIDEAVSDLESKGKISKDVASALRDVSRAVAERMRERSGKLVDGLVRNINVSNLSDDEYRKLMDLISELDLKSGTVGSGKGSGILSSLWTKLLLDPRTRAYIRSRIRDLRTAAYYREMRWPRGKRLEPRETFRKYFRTGIPFPPVYKTTLIRPRTREDVVFFVDVSGSMSASYPVIYAVMKAMEDLGLNVRMYAGDVEVRYVSDVDRVLAEVGGGGTEIGSGVQEILSELGSTLRDTSFIVYTDLFFDREDFERFKSALSTIRGMGSKVSVWIYDCGDVSDSDIKELENAGLQVVCDVKSMGDMLKALNDMRKELIK